MAVHPDAWRTIAAALERFERDEGRQGSGARQSGPLRRVA
jgi:hypothetical protein